MPEQKEVFKEKLKHKGFFTFSELYNYCYTWLRDEAYNVDEHEYTEKLTATGKEIVIKWQAWRKISDYFKYVIKADWRILHMQDAEVERDGKKEKTNKGEVEVIVKAYLERDWESRWERNPTYKFFRGIYDKYIIQSTMDEYEDRLTDKTVSFVNQMKSFLVLEAKGIEPR